MVPTPSAAFAPTAVPSPRCCLAASIVDRTASVTDAMTASAGAGLAQRSPMADDQHDTARPVAPPSRTDYTVTKGEVSLAIYRKQRGAPAPGQPPCPVLFLVHGSSHSALSSFALPVPCTVKASGHTVILYHASHVTTLHSNNSHPTARHY